MFQKIFRLNSLFLIILTIVSCSKNSTNPGHGCDHCILFHSGGYYHTEIFTICPDGTNLRQLTYTEDLIRNYDASWSPDGSKIVFYRVYWTEDAEDSAWAAMYIMNTDGSNEKKLRDWGAYPLFSPDGTKIAFCSNGLYTMNPDGSEELLLTDEEGGPHRGYSWSPDGLQFVYGTRDKKICKINSDGTGRQELTTGIEPRWSPDGSLISFTTPWESNDIIVMNPDGSDQRQLTDFTIETASWSVWSPDGTQILFLVYDKKNTENSKNNIYIMNRDGTEQKKLTDNNAMKPAWSPDGSQIAYMCDQRWTDNWQIWVMEADGSNQTKLTTIGGSHPTWQP